MQHKLPPKTSELYSLYNFYIVNASNSSCSKNKRGHKCSKYIWTSSSQPLLSLTAKGSLCCSCKSCLRSRPPGKDHCLQMVTIQPSKQGSTPECCEQRGGSGHRDLYCQNWGPCCCNRETVISVAEVRNVAVNSPHSPVLLGTPQSCFMCYPLTHGGPDKTSFFSP